MKSAWVVNQLKVHPFFKVVGFQMASTCTPYTMAAALAAEAAKAAQRRDLVRKAGLRTRHFITECV